MSIPFGERGGVLRGAVDLVAGRFPRFVFGGGLSDDVLPVFHFHDEGREDLEPKLRYLSESGYTTVTSPEIERFVEGRAIGARRVALCFDDAWASVGRVAAPLLRQYSQTAIVFAIPGRLQEDGDGSPFVTWRELRTLAASGILDVQSHTLSHSKIFCSPRIDGFVTPDYERTPLLDRPQIAAPPRLRFAGPADLGAPLFSSRSRMSDGRRMLWSADIHQICVDYVAREGGDQFFARPDWRARLTAVARSVPAPRAETAEEQRQAIEDELASSRAMLNDRLRITTVNHICLPWGVSGAVTAAALKRVGYRTAFANRLRGLHAVRMGDHPYWLKRLPNKYIFRLPGRPLRQ